MDAENLAATGIRFPDRPARSESLYRLRYRGPLEGLGGGQNRPWVVETLSYEGVKLERRKRLVRTVLNMHTPLSLHSPKFFCPSSIQ